MRYPWKLDRESIRFFAKSQVSKRDGKNSPRYNSKLGEDFFFKQRRKWVFPKESIVVIRLSSIGDVVLATACLNALLALKSDAQITWIGKPPSLDMMVQAFPQIQTCSVTDHKKTQEVLKNASLVIDLQGSWRTFFLCWRYAKIFYSVKKDSLSRMFLVWSSSLISHIKGRLFVTKPRSSKFQYQRMLETLKPIIPQSQWPELMAFHPFFSECQNKIQNPSCPTLGVSGGASYDTKKSPPKKTAEIIMAIHQKAQTWQVIFFGDKHDRLWTDQILSFLPPDLPFLDLVGKVHLKDIPQTLAKEVSCVLSHDSSLAHMAEAAGKPAFVLFGPTVEEFGFRPWQKHSGAFSARLGCRPCSKHGKKICRFQDKLCFEMISSADVASKIASVLFGS